MLGLPFLAVRGRWREAGIAAGVGLAMLVVSVVLSPDAWRAYLDFVLSSDPLQQSSFVAVPLPIRAVAGLLLAIVAGRLPRHVGDPLLVVAVTLALPSLWFTGLSLLVGIVPLVMADRRSRAESAGAGSPARVPPAG